MLSIITAAFFALIATTDTPTSHDIFASPEETRRVCDVSKPNPNTWPQTTCELSCPFGSCGCFTGGGSWACVCQIKSGENIIIKGSGDGPC